MGFELTDYIEPEEVLGFDGVFAQRQITVQTYSTNLPFERGRLWDRLNAAWLGPVDELGVVQFLSGGHDADVRVVVGFQGVSKVRTFDYESRKAHRWIWRATVLDTAAIRYSADEHGMLRFTTVGGGLRIRPSRVREFHERVLNIRRDESRALQFDPYFLGRMCFSDDFLNVLFSLKARLKDVAKYGSIEQAEFQSQKYLEPDCDVMRDLRAMERLPVEAFESVVNVKDERFGQQTVRFAIRATSGALRLRLPDVEPSTPFGDADEQTHAFYDFAEAVTRAIVKPEMYLLEPMDPAEADPSNPAFAELVDTGPYREFLRTADTRRQWLMRFSADEPRWWVPHIHALDELLAGDLIQSELTDVIDGFVCERVRTALAVLDRCRRHGWTRLGALLRDRLVANIRRFNLQALPVVEDAVLDYGFDHDTAGWDVDPASQQLLVHELAFELADLRPGAVAHALLTVARCLHARLGETPEPDAELVRRCAWAITTIRERCADADVGSGIVRLIAAGAIPRTPAALRLARPGLPPASGPETVETALLAYEGLPLWPNLVLTGDAEGWTLRNDGAGTAFDVVFLGNATRDDMLAVVAPGTAIRGTWPSGTAPERCQVHFSKYCKGRVVLLPVEPPRHASPGQLFVSLVQPISEGQAPTQPRTTLTRSQIARRLKDLPEHVRPIGVSPALQAVIEQVLRANVTSPRPVPILLLGETGVGKTRLFELLHATSDRRTGPSITGTGAGGAGGDPVGQHGMWVGYGEKHGYKDVPPNTKGKLAEAQHGSLFIDDFEQLSTVIQGHLLAAVEGRPVDLVGKGQLKPDVRIVMATNGDLEELVKTGKVRDDLLARFPVGRRITVPPLRDRKEDVLPLATHFAAVRKTRLTDRALLALLAYDWPKNVRELEAAVDSGAQNALFETAPRIDLEHLSFLPGDVTAPYLGVSAEQAERQLWETVDAIAATIEPMRGRQRVVTEMLNLSEGEVSKTYARLGLKAA